MSVDYSILVAKPETTERIKAALEKALDHRLELTRSDPPKYYSARLLGLDISLIDEVSYENDLIPFAQYGHEIMVEFVNGAFDRGYGNDWELMTATILANMLSLELKCECIVIRDVGTIVERFGPDK